jgi:hypothetical protein
MSEGTYDFITEVVGVYVAIAWWGCALVGWWWWLAFFSVLLYFTTHLERT